MRRRKPVPIAPGEWTEDDLLKNLRELAHLFGWRFWHIHDSRRQTRQGGEIVFVGDPDIAGFPDVVMVKGPWILFAELKGRNRWPTDEQWVALYELVEVAEANPYVEVFLLHSHVDDDFELIAEKLSTTRY